MCPDSWISERKSEVVVAMRRGRKDEPDRTLNLKCFKLTLSH